MDNSGFAIFKDFHPRVPHDIQMARPRKNSIENSAATVGYGARRAKGVLGRVHEVFLSRIASAEGKKVGEFYTPRCVVKLLVEILEPYRGLVYDPCCGSPGMFVQSVEFIRGHFEAGGDPRRRNANFLQAAVK